MSTRAQKIAAFGQNYANALRAKKMASKPSPTSHSCSVLLPVQQAHLPVPRYMLSEQAHIREFGYSH